MTADTEKLVLLLLRDLRKELGEQRMLLLGAVEYMRRIEYVLDGRIAAVDTRLAHVDERVANLRDDLEMMIKSELMGRLGHFETTTDIKLDALAERLPAVEARS